MIRQMIGIAVIALTTGGHATVQLSNDGRVLKPSSHTTAKRIGNVKTVRRMTYPLPAGYSSWWFNDPACPDNPDSFAYYVEWWNEDESFAYDQYAGHSSYYCGSTFVPQTLDGSSVYQNCVSTSPPQWNCQLLYQTWNTHP